MIVNTYEEATPIVIDKINQGKKIGFFSPGGETFHDGYKASCIELKKHCNFSICQLEKHYDEKWEWATLWGYQEDPIRYKEYDVPESTLIEYDQNFDLIIKENRPMPTDVNILKEIKDYTDETFGVMLKQYGSLYLNQSFSYVKIMSFFASLYYTNKYFFPIDVFVNSYKDGLWRFMRKKAYKQYLNIDCILIPPIRDENGMLISTSSSKMFINPTFNVENFNNLKNLLKNSPLITSKNDTLYTVQNKLYNIGWKVINFEKYSGDLLDDTNFDTYITIMILSPCQKILYHDYFAL